MLPDSLFIMDWVNGLLIFKPGCRPPGDSVRVEYQSFPLKINKIYQHKDVFYNRIDPPVYHPPGGSAGLDRYDRFSDGNLRSAGSLSRGLSAGNNRDASLTSNLNLQLEGNLNRDYRIEATLTDANIPVQPEGNTQQIQEFDKVFMRIYNPANEILAGDFDLLSPEGFFLKMNKRVQGARYALSRSSARQGTNFRSSTAAAIVKGKYARNSLSGTEGNQGPYVLTGAEGESYIQVIAGSEKVYIDGRLLIRGEEADYVIDYNTAEIRFTPKNLITKDKRIQVEFEYTERSYARFLLFNENRWTGRTGTYYANVYSEHDARNQPVIQDLTDEARALLAGIGDQEELARISAVKESRFLNDRVMYKLIDTLANGVRYDSVLVHSLNPDSARFEASFTFTGTNNGHYRQSRSAANGRVFEWVAPLGGVLQGSYEPVTRLVRPRSKQLITAGMKQSVGKRMSVGLEWALSRNDQNLFSSEDDEDNIGMGVKAGIVRNDYLKRDSTVRLQSSVDYRYSGLSFDPVERYREVEYERDWNLLSGEGFAEHLVESGLRLIAGDSLGAVYRLQYLSRPGSNQGLRQLTEGKVIRKSWETGWNAGYLITDDVLRDTRFLRHTAWYRRRFGSVRLELSENAEDNRWKAAGTDFLMGHSAGFQEFRLEAMQKRGERQPWVVRLSERTDLLTSAGRLEPASRALEAESWIDIAPDKKVPVKAGFHYRHLLADTTRTSAPDNGQSLTARIDTRWKAFNGILSSQTFFEIGSGYDRKPEYSYLEVATGQGYYTWNDYNGNNIRELDEFEAASFRDQASFIRVFRLGTELTPTLLNQFNQILTLQPSKGFLSRFASQLAYRIDKKNTREDLWHFLNPFTTDPTDPSLISLNSQIRHTLSFNRGDPSFNINLVSQKQSSRTTLSNGAEGKVYGSHALQLRYRFHPAWQLNSTTDLYTRKSVSEFFVNRNYQFTGLSELLRIECQSERTWRISIDEEIRTENNPSDSSRILSNQVQATLTAELPEKGQVSLSAEHIYIRFTGESASPAGYAMLRGLSNGHNGIARASVRYKLGRNLILEAVYEGRISGDSKPVHTAQLQVRAVF